MKHLTEKIAFKHLFLIVQIAVVCVFLGRAWQHLFWDAPLRTLLWDEKWMRFLVEGVFGYEWEVYVKSSLVDQNIQAIIRSMGYLYFGGALAAIFIRRAGKAAIWLLYIGGILLIFLAFLYWKEKFFHLGQFFEYALQCSAPFFLIHFYKQNSITTKAVFWIKLFTALTFTCHGLYAVGYYPRPGHFISMVMNILGLGEEGAILFLNIAGVLDFIASLLIFFPRKIALPAVAYMIFWGFGTSIARVWSNFYWDFWSESLNQFFYESLYRFPHFLIPLVLLLVLLPKKANTKLPKSQPSEPSLD